MKRSSQIYIVVFVVIMVLAGLFVFSNRADAPDNSSQTSQEATQEASEQNEDNSNVSNQQNDQSFTAEEVAEHDKNDDCWTIINGSVYNITSYISRHPGGDEIERACGKDATRLFNERTTDDGEKVGSGSGHSGSARAQLEQLKIGTLKN